MTEARDFLDDLRAWRAEFARAHGYDMRAMGDTLRARQRLTTDREIVTGVPRPPAVGAPTIVVPPEMLDQPLVPAETPARQSPAA